MVKNSDKRMKLNKELLTNLWVTQNKSLKEISLIVGYSQTHLSRMMKKFGISKSKNKIYAKINNTRIVTFKNKYGCDHYMKSDVGYESYKKSLINSTGFDNIGKLEKSKEKRKKNCIEKYGVDHVLKVKSIRERQHKTLIKHFGSYDNFKQEMSKSSSLKCKNFNGSSKTIYDGKFGRFSVRSLLERNLLLKFEENHEISLIEYEKRILINNAHRLPDFHIAINNLNIIVEAKYHRYVIEKPYSSKSWDKKYYSMWENSQKQLNDIKKWCDKNDYKFLIITEININKFHHLLQDLLLL